MNKKVFFVMVYSLFLCLTVYSQDIATKMGNIPEINALMMSAPYEPDAPAIVLQEEVLTRFAYADYTFRYETTHFVRMKVFKEEGAKYAKVRIPYSVASSEAPERITNIAGATYQWNGKKFIATKMSKSAISDTPGTEGENIVEFTLPDVKSGSIIEYKYTLISFQLESLRDWTVQREIPVKQAKYRIIIPEFFFYDIKQSGSAIITVDEISTAQQFGKLAGTLFSKNSNDMTMETFDLPSFSPEKDLIYGSEDFRTAVHFKLDFIKIPNTEPQDFTTNWELLDKELIEKIYPKEFNAKQSIFENASVQSDDKTPDILLNFLYMLRKDIDWDGTYSVIPSSIDELFQKKSGNSATLNILLVNLFKSLGYDAFPIVLRTKDQGYLNTRHAQISDLNHLIVGVNIDNNLYCMDAVSPYCGANALPLNDLVEQARMIRPDGKSNWLNLSGFGGSVVRNISCKFNESGELEGEVMTRYLGEESMLVRSQYTDNGKEQKMIEDLKLDNDFVVREVTPMNWDKLKYQSSLQWGFSFTNSNLNLKKGIITLNPMLIPFMEKNNLQKNRQMPVDFSYPQDFQQVINISFPEGYVIESLLESKILKPAIEGLSVRYMVAYENNQLQLNFNIRMSRAFFTNAEYKELQKFFESVAEMNANQITLKKKQ